VITSWILTLLNNAIQHDRTKHIEINRHFIEEKLNSGLITSSYFPIGPQLADIFIKGLPTEQFHDLACKLGMIDIYSPA